MSAAELSINAASQADITRASLLGAIATQAKSGGKLTQDAIANLPQVSQGWVSKFFAGLGGWRVWRKIITSLIKGSIRAGNNLELLSEDEGWIAQEYLPLLVSEFEDDPVGVAEAVGAIALGYGAEAWRRILAGVQRNVVAQLLGMMLLLTPSWMKSQLFGGEDGLILS
jgi:hypothetical protein